MRRVTRVLWSLLGGGVFVAAVALVYLSILLHGEGLRARAETTLTRTLGRPVSIGRLDLSLWAGRVTADDFRIADDPRFGAEPFIEAAKVRIGIELLPLLLRREVRFDSFVLEAPSIRLLRDASGVWNYSTLIKPRTKTPSADAPVRTLPDVAVSDIAVEGGSVLVGIASKAEGAPKVRDRRYGPVELSLKHFSLEAPFAFRLSAGLPADGHVAVSGTAGPWRVDDASATPFAAHLRAKHLDLEAAGLTNASSAVSGQIEDIVLDLAWSEHSFHVSHLDVDSPKLTVVSTRPPPTSPGTPPRRPSFWSELLRHLSVEQAKVRVGALAVTRLDGRTVLYRRIDVHLDCWCENTWSPFSANATLGNGANLRASGRFLAPKRQLDLFSSQQAKLSASQQTSPSLRPTDIDARVSVSHLDLGSSGLLSSGSAVGGLVEATGQVQSTANSFRVNGTARIDRLKLAKNGQPSAKPVLASFSVAQVRRAPGEKTTGTIQHATFASGGARVNVFGSYQTGGPVAMLNLRASGDAMPIDQIEAFLPTVGVQLPEGSRLTGGTLTTSLAVSGASSNLTITGPLRVVGTRLMGFDLGSKLASLSKYTGGRLGSTGGSGTTIRSLSLDLHTGNGQIVTDNISAEIAGIGIVTGAGSVGEGATLHYGLSLKLNELVSGSDGGAGLARDLAKGLPGAWASRALGAIDYLNKGPMKNGIPILIGGTARHPTVTPNIGALLPPNKPRR